MKIQSAEAFTTETVIGEDSEFADIGNPRGYLYGPIHIVRATTQSGRRFLHEHIFPTPEGAHALAQKVQARGGINLTHWSETYPEYGSQAWEEEDRTRQVSLASALRYGTEEDVLRFE